MNILQQNIKTNSFPIELIILFLLNYQTLRCATKTLKICRMFPFYINLYSRKTHHPGLGKRTRINKVQLDI